MKDKERNHLVKSLPVFYFYCQLVCARFSHMMKLPIIDGGRRLVFEPANESLPRKEDGGIDWSEVTAVHIVFIFSFKRRPSRESDGMNFEQGFMFTVLMNNFTYQGCP